MVQVYAIFIVPCYLFIGYKKSFPYAFFCNKGCICAIQVQYFYLADIQLYTNLKYSAISSASFWSDFSRCNILLQFLLFQELVWFYSSFLSG